MDDVRAIPAELPVDAVLGDLRAALDDAGVAVLQGPPGAGKTTRVPLDLLAHGAPGRLVLLEPRRVAARAAARRLSSQLGEQVGGLVGLTTRDERRTSRATRIEVVTEGVLLRRLHRDPALEGVGTVFLDEFHERSIEADLALAFTLEARATLRPDLRVLVASATLDGDRVARLLGDAPVVVAEGRRYDVAVEHRDHPGRGRLAPAVRDAIADGLAATTGDVLVFLPGAAEIRAVVRALAEDPPPEDPVVAPLHGTLPAEDQDAALAPPPPGRRKVVLSTDVAESSITIEGVRVVVDAGLAREPRFDATTGMTGLVTVPASRAAAAQRAGRAGRTGPGLALRLWPAREHAGRDAHPRPAITVDDLSGAALEVAAWGTAVDELALLDKPPRASWERAQRTLSELGALDRQGRLTDHGRRMAELPVHPRLANVIVRGADRDLGGLACEVAAVLADRDLLITGPDAPCADVTARVRVLRGEAPPPGVRIRGGALRRARREARRLARIVGVDPTPSASADATGQLLVLGWPDRAAVARPHRRGAFLLAGGRGATLPEADLLAGEPWLAVAHVHRGGREARILLAAPIARSELREVLRERVDEVSEVAWDGDVVAERREMLGALVLDRAPLADPDPDALLAAVLDGLRQEGLELLGWNREARQLQARIGLLRRELGPRWPDVSDEVLRDRLDEVVAPFLLGARRRADLAAIDAGDVLRSQLTPEQIPELEQLAPTHVQVPSGSWLRLDYTAEAAPVLAVRVQEMFGARTGPTVVGGRVPVRLHLLSPAQRPVQVTDDLAGFWARTYRQVRAELRGRYPKHHWPEDPLRAQPRRGVR